MTIQKLLELLQPFPLIDTVEADRMTITEVRGPSATNPAVQIVTSSTGSVPPPKAA